MSVSRLYKAISRCDFLLDWQKEKLLPIVENSNGHHDGDGDGDADPEAALDEIIDQEITVLDNVLWRTMGTSFHSLPVYDKLEIRHAIRESVRA